MLKPDETNGILLNTPNRKEILNDGPPLNCKTNFLGKGAYGVVFKAVFCEKAVAVKIVKNQEDFNQQILLNEANILGWSHRNIMRIMEIESTLKYGIIIMERFDGQCLQSILDTMSLPLKHRILISLDIIAALAFCHEHGLLHLDVKPQNVFVCYEKRNRIPANNNNTINVNIPNKYLCKLCDFGASTLLHQPQQHRIVQGTVRYMSPEVLCADVLTPAADIYSLGITMWQLKYRQIPYNWIQCNDIVAYRVVKHQLRPDAKIQFEPLNSTLMSAEDECRTLYCQCDSTASENPPTCLQEVSDVLHAKGLKSLNAVHVPNNNFSKKKRVFRELNLNVNLNESISKTTKQQNHTNHVENDNFYIFKEIFSQKNNSNSNNNNYCDSGSSSFNKNHNNNNNNQLAERCFVKIYQNCWHSDKSSRPLAIDVRNKLKKLLLYV